MLHWICWVTSVLYTQVISCNPVENNEFSHKFQKLFTHSRTHVSAEAQHTAYLGYYTNCNDLWLHWWHYFLPYTHTYYFRGPAPDDIHWWNIYIFFSLLPLQWFEKSKKTCNLTMWVEKKCWTLPFIWIHSKGFFLSPCSTPVHQISGESVHYVLCDPADRPATGSENTTFLVEVVWSASEDGASKNTVMWLTLLMSLGGIYLFKFCRLTPGDLKQWVTLLFACFATLNVFTLNERNRVYNL